MTDLVAIALIGAVPATLSALLSMVTTLVAIRAHKVINILEKNTNSIKDELVKVTGESEHAKGRLEGIASEKAKGE